MRPGIKLAAVALVLGLLAALTLSTAARPEAYRISSHVIGAGGGQASGAAYSLNGTLGQPFTGVAEGGPYRLSSGFWRPLDSKVAPPPAERIYLPSIMGR